MSGNWCAELNAAIDHVQAASVREGAPQKMADGRSPPLSDGMLAALEAVVRVVKIDFGAPVFPPGLLAEMMEFLEPFCSQATLGKNMNKIAKNLKGGAATVTQPKAVANGVGVANGVVLEPTRVFDVAGGHAGAARDFEAGRPRGGSDGSRARARGARSRSRGVRGGI